MRGAPLRIDRVPRAVVHERVAAVDGHDPPQLTGCAVGLCELEHGAVHLKGLAARGDRVEPGALVVLEVEGPGDRGHCAGLPSRDDAHCRVKRAHDAVRAVRHCARLRCGQRPGLGGRAVCGVEPHLGALARVAPLAVERHAARRARDRPAAAAGLDAPELRRGSVGLGKGCGAAGRRERQPAARQPVEPRRLVVGERQSRPRRAQRAAGRAGRHGHAAVERGRQAVVAVVYGPLQYGCFVFCFQVVLSAPFADRFLGDVRSRGQLNLGVFNFPLPLIHRICNNPILNSRNARREGLVVGVDGKALFLGI